jgi:hypothetical protein
MSVTVANVVGWMADHGHPGYLNEIHVLESLRDETIGDAGRYWQYCEFTQAVLAKIDASIAEVRRTAWDRYDDWATD